MAWIFTDEASWRLQVSERLARASMKSRALSLRWGITTENARHLAIEGGTVMNELIQQLKSRVGLDDDKAQSAVQTVVEFLKQRLPAPVASQLDSAISGGGINSIKDKAEGIFGKKTA
jgi:hypothetical protein